MRRFHLPTLLMLGLSLATLAALPTPAADKPDAA